MNNLPEELVYEILSYNHNYDSNLNEINKKCKQIFNKNKFKYKIHKIMNWYKQKTLHIPEDLFDIQPETNKSIIIKYYRKYYPMEYFKEYPEFFIRKLKRQDLQDFVDNNLNKDINQRTKIELIHFLNHPSITTGDLAYVGL